MAWGTEGPCRSGMNEKIRALSTHIRTGVQIPYQPIHQGGASRRVSTARARTGKLHGGERTASFRAGLEFHVRRGPVAHAQIGLFAGEKELHRPPGPPCKERGNNGIFARLELAPKTTAQVMPYHSHLGKRQAENLGHPLLDRINSLGGLTDHQLVSIPVCQAAVQFQRCMQFALGSVALLQDYIGPGKPFFNISSFVDGLFPYPVAPSWTGGALGSSALRSSTTKGLTS